VTDFLHYLALVGVALVATLIATPIVRDLSVRASLVDRPGGRKVHVKAVPRLGGIGIFVGFAAALAVQVAGGFAGWWPAVISRLDLPLMGTLAGCVLIFIVGLIDDLKGLSAGMKFGGQLTAAAIPIAAGLHIQHVPLGLLTYPVTALWIVGFANVFNLIDGLDGLAAGVAAIAAASFLLIAVDMETIVAGVLAASLIGACVGFLRYNFHPASIIMGDSGALLIGFVLGCTSLLGVMKSAAALTLVAPLIVIGVPVFDTGSAIIRRWRSGRPIHEADNGHIHHRLLHLGFSQRQTVLTIYAWSAALAIGGYLMGHVGISVRVVIFLALAGLSGVIAWRLRLFEKARVHGDDEE